MTKEDRERLITASRELSRVQAEVRKLRAELIEKGVDFSVLNKWIKERTEE